MSIETTRITFEVEGATIVGVLRTPQRARGVGAVTLGPLTSVKEQAAGAYAQALAERGFTTLAFDPRGFGESGGAPRQYESPQRKVADMRAAANELERRGLATVVAVGVCAGAGYAAGAVAGGPFAAFGAVAGFFHDVGQQRAWMGECFEAAVAAGAQARRRFESTGEAAHIPAVGHDEDVAMPLEEAFAYYGTPRGAHPNYTNRFATMSREMTLPWDAQGFAPRIDVPTLLIHSEAALAPAQARSFASRLGGPHEMVWVESQGQIDFYDDPNRIEPAADRLSNFFAQVRPSA
ncbi:MAG: alpha/beta hydrolase [Myxococcota bacterium]